MTARKEFFKNLAMHLDEMENGASIIFRKDDGKWQVISMSGAYVVVGHGETPEEAYWSER